MTNETSVVSSLPTSLANKVDQIFSEWDKPESPGAALAIVKDGEIVYRNGYGYASLEYDIPITASTVFHVASVSKQFTAMAITMLADEGKLSLDDDIHTYVPELADFGRTITIKHLIHHTSGLRDQWELLMLDGYRLDDVITRDRIMKLIVRQKELNFDPGEEFLYSNTGYTLMAEIVERVTGKTLAEYAREKIFKPLGMNNTHFHDDHEMIVKNRAYSYAPDGDYFKKRVLSFANIGATSLFTTAEDLCKWIYNFDHKRVGGDSVIEQMHEQFVLNSGEEIDYAHGLKVGSYRGLKTVCHSGLDAGFRSHIVRFPEQGVGIVVLVNLRTINPEVLSRKVADVILSDACEGEQVPSDSTIPSTEAISDEKMVGKYLIGPGMVMTITKENNHLMIEAPFSPKCELTRTSTNEFIVTSWRETITCSLDNSGTVVFDLTPLFGRTVEAKRMNPPVLNRKMLEEFVGDYYCEELDTHYNVVLCDEHLVVEHLRMPDCPLIPSGLDVFEGVQNALGRIKFTRNENSLISGFNITGGRVRNIRFVRR